MPDIIITNWKMEPLDGLDFIRLIRKGQDVPTPYVPIILLTGYTELYRVLEARDTGVTEILAKPISIKALHSRIVSIIEQPRPFIKAKHYFGPDRRRGGQAEKHEGPQRRAGDADETSDGPTATREIRQLPKEIRDIPIIALTANAMAGHREEYLAAGMNDYVSKPIDETALFAAIARACGHDAVVPGGPGSVDDTPDGGGHEELDAAATEALQSLLGDLGEMMPSVAPEDEEAQPSVEDETAGGTFAAEVVPLFDEAALDQLRSALGDEVFCQMLKLVPGESARLLSDIQWALGKGDLQTAQRYAHSLKGMASNYAATRIAALASQIQDEAPTLDAAKEKTASVKRAIEETRQWIEETA